jgi:hypothetical protein
MRWSGKPWADASSMRLAKLAPPQRRNDIAAWRIEAERETLTAERGRLMRAIASGAIEEDEVREELTAIRAKLAALQRKATPPQPEAEELRSALQSRKSQFLILLRSERIAARR